MLQNAKTTVADPLAAVRRWLFAVAGLIALMVLAGGAARLAVSGFSITEWKPITGVMPPLSQDDWRDAFEKYKQNPQYAQIFADMDLSRFQTIYLWEWAHRVLGRLIALAFALPLAFFWLKGLVTGALRGKLLFILALGGLQGFVGWWMVYSGLSERTAVAQARLVLHLLLACFTFVAILWTAEGLRPNFRDPMGRDARGFRIEAGLLLALVFAQIGFGALVAGARAGLAYNTWPLIDGRFIPPAESLFSLTPLWANFFDNALTVQFQHRMAAYLALLLCLFHAFHISRERLARRAVRRALALALLILAQAGLGVTTLLLAAPLPAALAHQALAVGVLALATLHRAKLG
ncbi:heme A synthase [Rhodoblastus acidophilus]|uniref:Heme A synthase n=1 Tax=Rhodoblastus acidophilus TaxID=1074 RepID=A0A6N8DR92_RHOAC|nr:COX15/CtaA family protein [Rhodoblastus acidophilus]MCW2275406.1 cytochrome c oxidase assembly protein subunit 15 [Rhodoblastus acidophilus]MTV31703.1 heme A synthase [Rhodoblastus acidophilus]